MSQLEEQAHIGDSEKKQSTETQKSLEFPLEIRALRNLQLETKQIHSEFFQKIYELEIDYQKKHEAVFQKRRDIVNGICIPRTATESLEQQDEAASAPGVPRFWSNVLSSTLFEIQKSDRPILEYLTDVRARNKPFTELGFVLEFDFSSNEYFENETLTKEYYYTSLGGKMVHQGPQIYKSIGCDIKWKNGKTVASDSFFNFFRTKTEAEETPGNDETFGMSNDFEMGYFIKERVIPRAVLFYNENFRIDDPPLRSELSYSSCEPMSPTDLTSTLAEAGSSCRNMSTTTLTFCDSSSCSG